MVIGLILSFMVHISCKGYPKFTFIYVGPGYNKSFADQEYKDQIKNKEKICKESCTSDEEYNLCLTIYDSFLAILYSEGPNINDILKKVSKKNEIVVIKGNQMGEMDFNKLKTQCKVGIFYEIPEYDAESYSNKKIKFSRELIKKMIKVSFDGSDESFMKLFETNKPKKLESDSIMPIVGNIKKKVSFLGIDVGGIRITKSDLNINSLGLDRCGITEDSKKIRTNFLVLTEYAYRLYDMFDGTDFAKVDQFSLRFTNYYIEKVVISYGQDSWETFYSFSGDDSKVFKVSYNLASIFNVIANISKFVIRREKNVNLDFYKPINLSAMFTSGYTEMNAKVLEKQKITIQAENWDDVDKNSRPKVTLSYDPNSFEFNPSDNPEFNIDAETKYSYKPQNKKKLSGGAIAGIVIACVVVVIIIIVVTVVMVRKKKAKENPQKF